LRLPTRLPFVDWNYENGELPITWLFLLTWLILALCFPLILRPASFIAALKRIALGLLKALYELAFVVPFLALLFGWVIIFRFFATTDLTWIATIRDLTWIAIIGLVLIFGMFIVSMFILVQVLRQTDQSKISISQLRWALLVPLFAMLTGWSALANIILTDLDTLTATVRGTIVLSLAVVAFVAFLGALLILLEPLTSTGQWATIANRLRSQSRFLSALRNNLLFFVTWAVLLVGWQVVSYVAPEGTLEHPLVPGFDYIVYNALWRLSGNWDLFGGFSLPGLTVLFGELAPFPAIDGAESRTWTAVFLALGFHSFMTLSRLIAGLGVGLIAGLATGLALPYWSALRQISWAPFNFLRMIPLLAAIPWMQFALGVDLRATTLFIGFGVWVMLVVATMNAVANVPDRFIESARTLGASRLRTYFKVIVPGAMPELRTALLLAGGLGWSLTIAAEFLGFPTGLGFMAAAAVQETNTARLVIVAIVVAFYSLLTFFLLNQMFNRMVSWMPQRVSGETDISKVAGAAGAASRAEAQLHE